MTKENLDRILSVRPASDIAWFQAKIVELTQPVL